MNPPAEHTLRRRDAATVTAPDGARVRVLLALRGSSMALFELEPGQVSTAVRHRTNAPAATSALEKQLDMQALWCHLSTIALARPEPNGPLWGRRLKQLCGVPWPQ
jgi:hypothetical protein